MSKFRKKPVVIEAVRLGDAKESTNRVLAWIGACGVTAKRSHGSRPELGLDIGTLEGEMHASPGDWIIKGAHGEFYPCKPHIFEMTYEPVE